MFEDIPPKQKQPLLAVGRFAQATQLSRKALRLYEQMAILAPVFIDRYTGYRYYSVDQIERARFIRLLRAMEMPLATIQQVLDTDTNQGAIQIIMDCQKEFEERTYQVQRAYHKVLAYLNKEELEMTIEISEQEIPAFYIVGLEKSITVPAFQELIPEALESLFDIIKKSGREVSGDPICFYYGPVNESDDGPVEICVPIQEKIESYNAFSCRQIPKHRVAIGKATIVQSQYPQILETWDAVIGWVHHHHFSLDEAVSCYEIWHEDNSISVAQPFISNMII